MDTGVRAESLGVCPECGTDIPSSALLIRYETTDGWPRMFAGCPRCDEVVHPR